MSLRAAIVAHRSILAETMRSCIALDRAMAPTWQFEIGANVELGRNNAAQALKEDVLLFIDSDMVFSPNDVDLLLRSLTARPMRGAVSACYVRWKDGVPVHGWRNGEGWMPDKQTVEQSRGLHGVYPVDKFGAGLLAVSKEAMGKIGHPRFECGYEDGAFISEDVSFCQKLKQAGFEPSVHFGARVGHIGPTTWNLGN